MIKYLLLTIPFLHAHEIIMSDESHLMGEITSISEKGEIILSSPNSPQPITLQSQELRNINFNTQTTNSPDTNLTPHTLHLANGDTLPIQIQSYKDQTLHFTTDWQQQLNTKHDFLHSLTFGNVQDRILYSGPEQGQWSETENWTFTPSNKSLTSQDWGQSFFKFPELPDRYILRFTLKWKATPNIRVFLSAKEKNANNLPEQDAYFLGFNNSGTEFKRLTPRDKKFAALRTDATFVPSLCENKTAEMEIRVDTTARTFLFFCNGKNRLKTIHDPEESGPSPTGKYIIFYSPGGSNNEAITISNISISSWDSNTTQVIKEERPENMKHDTIFDKDSNRYSGELISIEPAEQKLQILFENPHQKNAQALPLDQFSLIYLAGKEFEKKSLRNTYEIYLQNKHILTAEQITLADQTLTAKHPILGNLVIPTHHIKQISKSSQ